MPKTLGALVNAGLKEIKEPEITAFTATNILQEALIERANNAVREIQEREEYPWTLERTTFTTTDDITTDNAAVTNASTTATSVDSSGTNTDSFTGVTTSMYMRFGSDKTSYKISSVDVASSPDTVVLENAYVGTTATAAPYIAFQDTYSLSASDFDEVKSIQYGDARYAYPYKGDRWADTRIDHVSLNTLIAMAGGDLHRDTGGKPIAFAQIDPDSSDDVQIVLWPYPREQLIMEVWYSRLFSENTTFATNMFSGDAPAIAYDVVEAAVCSAANLWDEDLDKVGYWDQRKEYLLGRLISRQNRTSQQAHAMGVNTQRRRYGQGIETRSQIAFDTKPAWRY